MIKEINNNNIQTKLWTTNNANNDNNNKMYDLLKQNDVSSVS